MGMLFYNKYIKFCIVCSMICGMAYNLPLYSPLEKVDTSSKQEIESYMKAFVSMYMSEVCSGKKRIFIKSKDIYASDFDVPVELIVYTNEKEENIRYKVHIYGETGNSITNYYLCENFIYVNQQQEYYSSQILMENYNDILYSQTNDWIILKDKVYKLKDNGELKVDTEYPFFSIEKVNDWVKGLEE